MILVRSDDVRPLSYSQLPPLTPMSPPKQWVCAYTSLDPPPMPTACTFRPSDLEKEIPDSKRLLPRTPSAELSKPKPPPAWAAYLRGISTNTPSIGTPSPLRTLLVQPRRNGVTNAVLVANTGEPTYVIEGTASAPSRHPYLWLSPHPQLANSPKHRSLRPQGGISIDEQYSPWPSRPCTKPKATSISWRKVAWDVFNATVERLYQNHPCHPAPTISVHTQTKALTQSFQLASKKLPRGCRPDPVSWMTAEVHAAMEQRDCVRDCLDYQCQRDPDAH